MSTKTYEEKNSMSALALCGTGGLEMNHLQDTDASYGALSVAILFVCPVSPESYNSWIYFWRNRRNIVSLVSQSSRLDA